MTFDKTQLPFPGKTIGIYGGGQLGKMLILEAARLGCRTVVLDPDKNAPAHSVADYSIVAPYSDKEATVELAQIADVVTYEFENVNAEAVERVTESIPVLPGIKVLRVAQNRLMEKEAAKAVGCPVANYARVDSLETFREAVKQVGVPGILKTAVMGYDGKGQFRVDDLAQVDQAWAEIGNQAGPKVYEEAVDLEKEFSVLVARSREGAMVPFPIPENRHENGILDTSVVPNDLPVEVATKGTKMACDLAENLEVIGLLTVEFFLARDGRVLVNEMAPRPHNSYHYTIEACQTSQFEQWVRILIGMPMGSVELNRPAAMVNLLGDVWLDAPNLRPNWPAAYEVGGVNLHIYGKREPRRGRKMGHLTVVADTPEEALKRALLARTRLTQ